MEIELKDKIEVTMALARAEGIEAETLEYASDLMRNDRTLELFSAIKTAYNVESGKKRVKESGIL